MTTLADIYAFGDFAKSSWTTIWDSVWAGVDKAALTQAQVYEKLAETYGRQFNELAARAGEAANTALAKADATGAQYWKNVQHGLEQAALDVAKEGALANHGSAFWKGISENVAGVAGAAIDGAQLAVDVTLAVQDNNAESWNTLGKDSAGIFYQLVGVEAAVLLLALLPFELPVVVVFGVIVAVAIGAEHVGKWVWDRLFGVDPSTKDGYDSAQRVTPPRRDPLVLDLDGDGLETTGLNATNPILFDHDGDGIKTGTGWVSAHDAFLVLDRNGNGVIDNGRELFGDSTLLANGSTAADGFAALQEQDTNGDGKVDASDTNFANLRLWQDLNQDGISQSNELSTLTALIPIPSPTSGRRERAEARSARVCSTGIASINVAATDHSRTRATCHKPDTEISRLHKLAA